MSFGGILARGFRAAISTPLGILGYLVVFGIQQAPVPIISALFPAVIEQSQTGGEPSPQVLAFFGSVCFTCLWLPVLVFAGPWVAGGTVGQLRDRIAGQPVGSFAGYGATFYLRMLILTLIFLAILFALYFLMGIVGAIITAAVGGGQPMDPQQFQEISRHPANIASGIAFGLVVTAIGVVFYLADARVVVENEGALAALGGGLRFCRDRSGDALKLFLAFVLLLVVSWFLYGAGQLFGIREIAALLVVGVILGVWVSFLVVLQLGLATSLYLARRPEAAATLGPRPDYPG